MAELKLLNRLSEDFLDCQYCLVVIPSAKSMEKKMLKVQKSELDCPTCRSKTLLPDGGVANSKLKDNFFVESLKDTVDVNKKLTNEGESLLCGSCETKSGAKYCTKCGDFLCDECVAMQRRMKVTRVIGVEYSSRPNPTQSNTIRQPLSDLFLYKGMMKLRTFGRVAVEFLAANRTYTTQLD